MPLATCASRGARFSPNWRFGDLESFLPAVMFFENGVHNIFLLLCCIVLLLFGGINTKSIP